ncbi:MAG: solute carrier family 23 protein [Erysipelotrichales bacterium]|nr:solute carrier family 23 protein [Erysipelotrichales bacterium]
MSKRLILDVNEKPKPLKWVLMSFQHVFAMFGATIAVPLALGMPVSVALFASGIGTLIYVLCTKGKVPIYLGSSFAYVTALAIAKTAMGGDISAGQTGLILVGIIYVIIAIIVRFTGTKWLHKILPPIVIGPMIIIIGLGLANYAVTSAGLVANGGIKPIIVALVAFVISVVISTKAKGFLKIVPFLVAIIGGYVVASLMGLVDFTPVKEASWIAVPEFIFPFKIGNFASYKLYFGPETFAILPLAIVTIAEHIGDHTVLGKICEKDFLQDPGLNRTLIGDGVATTVSALIGGPANTTYGENTGVIGLTGVASVWVTSGAAVIAVLISFLGKFTALLQVMPSAVMGGMSIILYGVIASNGLRTLIDNKVDFNETRNLIIASSMLVIGLGGAVLNLEIVSFSGTALAALVGVILNLVLPQTKKEKKVEKLEKELVDNK